MDNHQTPSFCHPPCSLTKTSFFLFLKTVLKVVFKHASEDHLPSICCSFTGNRWTVAREPVMPAGNVSGNGWSEDGSAPTTHAGLKESTGLLQDVSTVHYPHWEEGGHGTMSLLPLLCWGHQVPGGTPKCPGRCCTCVSHITLALVPSA